MLPKDMSLAQEYLTPKRHAFNDAVYKTEGKSLQDVNIEEVLNKLVELHYKIDPIVFDWDNFTQRDPGDRHNFVWRTVRVSGDVGLLAAKIEATPHLKKNAGHLFELKGSTLTVMFFVNENAERNREDWERDKSRWEALAAEALKVGLGERQSDINFARQDLEKKAENYRRKQVL